MHTPVTKATSPFTRQVVFRISADDWPLLEAAAQQHGSIRAAILAGLRALAEPVTAAADETPRAAGTKPATAKATSTPEQASDPPGDPEEEIRARHAAKILGVKASTVSGYIRSGRLPGRYDNTLGGSGWVTTRGAVEAYRKRIRRD